MTFEADAEHCWNRWSDGRGFPSKSLRLETASLRQLSDIAA